ncbi:unnamed protein product [Colias eurytheme]|nr:unnamed protein product [Colias eurytheme]
MKPPGQSFAINLRINLRKIKKRVIFIWSALIFNGVAYIVIPLVTPGRHFPEDLFVVYGLEPMFETPNFEIANLMMNISIVFSVFSLANVTALILILVGYTEAQMLTLGEEMLNLWDKANQHTDAKRKIEGVNIDDLKNIFVKTQLAQIAHLHVVNIQNIRKLEYTFRLSKALEFLIGMNSIITELLGGIENTFIQMPYTFALIYIDCVAGQRLIDACQVFEEAVYSCNWEYFNVENMKTVSIILQNSQKTLTLTAGGIAVLDYACMVSFFKFCYSMYTTLRMVLFTSVPASSSSLLSLATCMCISSPYCGSSLSGHPKPKTGPLAWSSYPLPAVARSQ